MPFHHLSNILNFVRMKVDGTLFEKAAGTTDTLTSNTLDMQADGNIADGVLFHGNFGTITATGTVAITVQESNDDGVLDAYVAATGAAVSIIATDTLKGWTIDIYRPKKRYLQVVFVRATANAAIDSLDAILYKVEQNPGVLNATQKAMVKVNNV